MKLWILRGPHEAPGWQALREDYEEEKVDIIHLDARVGYEEGTISDLRPNRIKNDTLAFGGGGCGSHDGVATR